MESPKKSTPQRRTVNSPGDGCAIFSGENQSTKKTNDKDNDNGFLL